MIINNISIVVGYSFSFYFSSYVSSFVYFIFILIMKRIKEKNYFNIIVSIKSIWDSKK